jgi:group II intron reverse transcriptase/maturase
MLGIPTVSDRIAQQVIKDYLEPRLEEQFHDNSYGYRPLKSAHDAVAAVQNNVREYKWVVDLDIKSFFDEVDHELLMKSLDRHVPEPWVKLYIRRWLESPVQESDGTLTRKTGQGTPQGGVISPLLANLFLHYVLDKWLTKTYPYIAFVRYADDIVIHCQREMETRSILDGVRERLSDCKLRLNEEKTKVVYCQDYRRVKKKQFGKKFDFLGFTFKPVSLPSLYGGMYVSYEHTMSQASQTRILTGWKKEKWHLRSNLTIQDIADQVNIPMRGIIRYYGKFGLWKLESLIYRFELRLVKWVLKKYRKLNGNYVQAYRWIKEMKVSYPGMFYYWTLF